MKIQFAGPAAGADSVAITEGAADDRNVLAFHRRAGHPVAVLATNQPRLFTCRHKQPAATS